MNPRLTEFPIVRGTASISNCINNTLGSALALHIMSRSFALSTHRQGLLTPQQIFHGYGLSTFTRRLASRVAVGSQSNIPVYSRPNRCFPQSISHTFMASLTSSKLYVSLALAELGKNLSPISLVQLS